MIHERRDEDDMDKIVAVSEIICLFDVPLYLNRSVYEVGRTVSKCELGRMQKYNGLCCVYGTNEQRNYTGYTSFTDFEHLKFHQMLQLTNECPQKIPEL